MSPDMNPIEHVWPIVGRMLEGQVFSGRKAPSKLPLTKSQPPTFVTCMQAYPAVLRFWHKPKGATPVIDTLNSTVDTVAMVLHPFFGAH